MTYPGAITSFTTKTDNVDDVLAAHMNAVQTDITAIETTLGTNPHASATDLKTRLAKVLSGAGMLQFASSTTLTIASGSVTPTQNYHLLDTEAAAATDDLDTITATAEAWILFVRTVSGARNVVIKHNTGNINCAGGKDITLDNNFDLAVLVYDANLAKWAAFRGPVGRFGDASNYSDFSNVGILTMAGTARVYKEIVIPIKRVTSGASAPVEANRAVGASGGVLVPVLQFSKTTQNDIHFEVHMQADCDTSAAVHFHIMWFPGASWTTGNFMWKLEYLVRDSSGTALNTGTPTTISADVTPSAATNMIETEFAADITLTADDQVLECHFYRDVANDNGDDVGELRFCEIHYTVNKLGVAL